MGPVSQGGSCEGGRVLSLREASSLVRRSAGHKGSLRGLDKSAASSLQQVEQRERLAQMVCVTSLHSPAQDAYLVVCTGAEC